jgi:hypothetical protein
MTPDDKIAAFLGAARPAAAEPAFNTAVMERLARREFARSLGMAAVLATAGGVALWATAPVLAQALEPMAQALATGVGILVVTASLLAFGDGVLRRA